MGSTPTTFFAAWGPTMAYVLGYWFADGNMYHQASVGGYTISIGSKDLEHLRLLQAAIGLGSLARITGSDVYKLVICRKAIYDDLLRLGGRERKSLTLSWPEVPAAQLAHFVRGYVDGDGSLGWHRSGLSVHPLVEAAGTEQFLSGMAEAIQGQTGIPAPKRHGQPGKMHKIAWYGIAAKCLPIWLYRQHPGLALERKAKLAEGFAVWQPQIIRQQRMTPQMWELFGEFFP